MNNIPVDQLAMFGIAAALVAALWLRGQLGKKKVKAALAAGALVIDVRSPSEYAAGHYAGAINIPHDKIAASLKKVGDPDRTIVLYCASGARSAAAASVLKSRGYGKVVNAGRLGAMPA